MPTPLPTQLTGAEFLAEREKALLADAPRVGKTGAAIIAADYALARKTLIITTASGRPVWARGLRDWSRFDLSTEVLYGKLEQRHLDCDRLVVGWPSLVKHAEALGEQAWDLVLADESHYAKSIEAKRTSALFGAMKGAKRSPGIVDSAATVWCLTGTPIPNAPNDLFPMLRALAPERLERGRYGPVDVLRYEDFLHRYCVVRRKAVSAWNKIDVVVGGKNLEELRGRLEGFWLRRTQADVGITAPIYEIMPVHLSAADRKRIEAEVEDAQDILDAAETGDTKHLELHLGTLRRLTGSIKAAGVIEAVREEFECGLDKIVLMAWHKDVLIALEAGLSKYGVVRVDGSTSPNDREAAQHNFQNGAARVFLGQIVACGEAIDLSAANELIFVESSFVPKDMSQAALRITNHTQTRQPRVRVAALEGSIDEALQAILTRKIATNREVLKQ